MPRLCLDCRDGHHASCNGCGCPCLPEMPDYARAELIASLPKHPGTLRVALVVLILAAGALTVLMLLRMGGAL